MVQRIRDELGTFVSSDSQFSRFHSKKNLGSKWYDYLNAFLESSMDEARLRHAAKVSGPILKHLDAIEGDALRLWLARRELSGQIDYSKQRDHTAHTLNNYLLGWYFYVKSEKISNAFKQAANKRGLALYNHRLNISFDVLFSALWPFVSLLHDVGYLLEGSLNPIEAQTQSNLVKDGARIVNEFLNADVLDACRICSSYDRVRFMDASEVKFPKITDYHSLRGVAFDLRTLPDLCQLTEAVLKDKEGPPDQVEALSRLKPLPSDSFDLWRLYYRTTGSKEMVQKINWVESGFNSLLAEGTQDTGTRILDHGVGSGLILLSWLTRFFVVHFNKLNVSRQHGNHDRRLKKRLERRAESYYPWFWWDGGVWVSAATAIHSLQQTPSLPKRTRGKFHKLGLKEDPLAYLGILVDLIQEWDRYEVRRGRALAGEMPLEGREMRLGVDGGKITVEIGRTTYLNDLRQSLDRCLKNWRKLLRICPVSRL